MLLRRIERQNVEKVSVLQAKLAAQDSPTCSQDASKMPQDAPKTANKCFCVPGGGTGAPTVCPVAAQEIAGAAQERLGGVPAPLGEGISGSLGHPGIWIPGVLRSLREPKDGLRIAPGAPKKTRTPQERPSPTPKSIFVPFWGEPHGSGWSLGRYGGGAGAVKSFKIIS